MFKLESYITPILLSYVEKYVKNIKAEQSQVSLWGGDVVFTNLDLRLDVLEQELRLPFSFVSGHIHELQIHVPWTRLNAEPIVITINTIECVLKLPSQDAESETASSTGPVVGSRKAFDKKKPKKPSEQEAPPGYVQSLINKIISNVTIVCNNLILKYVEEDIVLSLNTRNLRLSSADELWQPAFTELSLPDLILRKVLKVTDLTVCLDRRNASGKIEIYQEPLLYRCSLDIHASMVYDSMASKVPRVSRYEIHCPKLEFSITDTQIPMFIRIAKLVLALYYGELAQKRMKKTDAVAIDMDGIIGVEPHQDDNWSWWSLGTSVGSALIPIYWDEDDEDQDVPELDEKREKVLHLGVFFDSASLLLKLTEHQSDTKSLFGSSKLCFKPYLRLDVSGICFETVVRGLGAVSVSGGFSELSVTPAGNCLCGLIDTKDTSEGEVETPFIHCGTTCKSNKQYLKGSLFEKEYGHEQSAPAKERQRVYDIDWDTHLETWTEEKMLERSPAVAFDYLYFMDIPEDLTSDKLSEIIYDLEYSDIGERALCRFVLGPMKASVCSGLVHRLEIIQHFASAYDYPPYEIQEAVESSGHEEHVKTVEDLEGLLQSAPYRVYQFSAINMDVQLYHANHSAFDVARARHSRSSGNLRSQLFDSLPGLSLRVECLDGHLSHPMYPKRLAKAASLVPNVPLSLVQNSYLQLVTKVINVSLHLINSGQSCTIMLPNALQVSHRQLLVPELWSNPDMATMAASMELGQLKFRATRPQVMTLVEVLKSYLELTPRPHKLSDGTLLEDALTKKMSSFVVNIEGSRFQYDLTFSTRTLQVTIDNFSAFLQSIDQVTSNVYTIPVLSRAGHQSQQTSQGLLHSTSPVKSSPGRALSSHKIDMGQSHEPLVSVYLQLPASADNQVCNSLIVGHFSSIQVNIDKGVFEWLSYQPSIKPQTMSGSGKQPPGSKATPGLPDLTASSSRRFKSGSPAPNILASTKSVKSLPTSDKAEGVSNSASDQAFKQLVQFLMRWHPTLNSMIIQLKLEGHQVYLPRRSLAKVPGRTVSEVLANMQSVKGDDFVILGLDLPILSLDNVAHKPQVQQFLQAPPFKIPESVWNIRRDNLPWTLVLQNMAVYSFRTSQRDHQMILKPFSSSSTIGINIQSSNEASPSVALCFHSDLAPISCVVEESQVMLVVNIIEDMTSTLAKAFPTYFNSKAGQDDVPSNVARNKSVTPEGSSTAPSFMKPTNMDTLSDDATSKQISEVIKMGQDTNSCLSIWVQWTMPHINTSIISKVRKDEQFQLRFEFEDCQISHDWTPVYVKMKARVQAARIRHQKRDVQGWSDFGTVLSCSDDLSRELHFVKSETNTVEILPHCSLFESSASLSSVFNMVYTRAACQSVIKKWRREASSIGSRVDKEEEIPDDRFVSEIDIQVAPVDLVVRLKILEPFVQMLSRVMALSSPSFGAGPMRSPKSDIQGLNINNNTLPLVFLKAKTLRLFLVLSEELEDSSGSLSPDLMLIHVGGITIVPQAENPLQRIVIRPEIFNVNNPNINIPGSEIEDRQYQLDITDFGVYTGSWRDVVIKSTKPETPAHKTMGENPAFEWNAKTDQTESENPIEVVLLPFLSLFDLQILAAPPVAFCHGRRQESVNFKLVAGASMEINATKAIDMHISLNQLELFSKYLLEIIASVQFVSHSLVMAKSSLDSGIESCEVSEQEKVSGEEKTRFKCVPFEVLITGSGITCSVFKLVATSDLRVTPKNVAMWRKFRYKHRRMEILHERDFAEATEESDTDRGSRMDAPKGLSVSDPVECGPDIGYEASEEESMDESRETIKIHPLIMVNLSQPHVFAKCTNDTQRVDLSIFDAIFNLAPAEYFITCGGRRVPETKDFPIFWFQTKPGDMNPKSGIRPALFSCNIQDVLSGFISVTVSLDRPLMLDLGHEHLQLLQTHLDQIMSIVPVEHILEQMWPKNGDCEKNNSKIEDKLSVLAKFRTISCKSKQIMAVYPRKTGTNVNVNLSAGFMESFLTLNLSSKKSGSDLNLDAIDINCCLDKVVVRYGVSGIFQNLLWPWRVEVKTKIYWLPSCSNLPLMSVNLTASHLHLQIGPNLLAMMTLLTMELENHKNDEVTKPPMTKVLEYLDTYLKQDSGPTGVEQYYVDDLRAGAFQYIFDGSASANPKPYQVVFSENPPSMTWKYPQPRTLTRVTVFPVPLMAAGEANEIKIEDIECSLQYWDVCLGSFQTYSRFKLSENQIGHLNLPTLHDLKRRAVSAVWRVEVHLNSGQEEGFEGLNDEADVIVQAKSLVSVMRVDSYFSPTLIPRVQMAVNVPSIRLDALNQLHFGGRELPSILKNYNLIPVFPLDQTVATLKLEQLSVGVDAWATLPANFRALIRTKTQIRIDLLDYSFLAMHSILDQTKIQAQINLDSKQTSKTVDIFAQANPIVLRAGHFAAHTFSVTKAAWSSVLDPANELMVDKCLDKELYPLTQFVICNDSPEPIRVGQADTEENQLLRPLDCIMYAWRSQKARLMMRVCVEGGYWKWCDPFSIATKDKTKIVRSIDHGTHKSLIFITCQRLNNVQVQVRIGGLLSASSLLRDNLELRVIMKPPVDPSNNKTVQEQRCILGSFCSTPSFIVDTSMVQGIKIRLMGIGTPWSGDIPLKIDKGRKNSVLVRIPTKEKGNCLTIWCRLCEEIMDPATTRIHLIFSPMYMARSLLPGPMKVLLKTTNNPLETEVVLPGREKPVQLETYGASDQKYDVSFKVVDDLPASDAITMSWGIIEQVRDASPQVLDIDDIISEVPKLSEKGNQCLWPYILDKADQNGQLIVSSGWESNIQPNTDVQVNFTQFHPALNTLCVEVNPWCLIVNQLGLPIILKESGGTAFAIKNNSVFVPPQIQSTFYIGIQEDDTDFFSPPLQLSDQEWHFRQLMPSVQGIIAMEGVCQTKIVVNNQICFVTIRTRNEHGIRVIHIKPTFLVCNQSKKSLQCAPTTVMVQKKMKHDLDKLDLVGMEVDTDLAPLLFWQIVGENSKQQVFDGFQHVSFSQTDVSGPWSLPLNLDDCRNIMGDRIFNVSLPLADDNSVCNERLLVTAHQLDGQVHIVIQEDRTSTILVENNLAVPIRCGQRMGHHGVDLGASMFSCQSHQVVPVGKKLFYNFPWLMSHFPFKNDIKDYPQLVLGCLVKKDVPEESDWEVVGSNKQWSQQISVTLNHEHFVNIPTIGDVRVTVENVGSITHVFVDPVSKIEITAKDIRSRIASGSSEPASPPDARAKLHFDDSDASFATVADTSDTSESSFLTVKSPETRPVSAVSKYHSIIEDPETSDSTPKDTCHNMELCCSVHVTSLRIILTDDCFENEAERDEYLSLTLQDLLITLRPRISFTRTLRSCNNALPVSSNLQISSRRVQLDNQMYSRQPHEFGVLLVGQDDDLEHLVRLGGGIAACQNEEFVDDLFKNSLLGIAMVFDSSQGVTKSVLKSVKVKVKPIVVNIEDEFLYKISRVLSSFFHPDTLQDRSPVELSSEKFALPDRIRAMSKNLADQLFLEEVEIDDLDVSISVHASIKMYIGLDQSPLHFSPFHRSHLITDSYTFGQMVARHYISGALFRAGWLVGSLEIIGSPAGLTKTVGDGLKDFVYLPYQGMFQGPWAFMGGVMSGSTSLVKHVSAGSLTSITNFASSVSRNLDRLSLDQEHRQRNEVLRRERPQGIGQGLWNGLSGVGISILGAVGGIAHHPLNAVMEQGMSPSGLVGGLTRGLVGAVAKPLGGAAEFVAQTGHGLLEGTGWSRRYKPFRVSIPDHVCSFDNGDVKYKWKLLASRASELYPSSRVTFVAEVSKGVVQASSCTLILTNEAITVINTDEDAQEIFLPLLEADCYGSDDDPTQICLKPMEKDATSLEPHKDRIAQFVMESGLHCAVSDLESEAGVEDNVKASGSQDPTVEVPEDNRQELVFFASPVMVEAFLSNFHILKRQVRHLGFDML